MRSKSLTVFSVGLLLLGALVSSCSRYPDSPSPVVSITLPLGASKAAVTPAPASPTATPRPPIPSATAAPTQAPAPTPTFTLAPTFTVEERQAYFLELLKTNSDCRLPCWWGITPGKTTWAEAEQFFSHLGFRSVRRSMPGGVIKHELGRFDFGNDLINNLHFYNEREGIIQSIVINSSGFYDPAYFREAWQYFSPENIIATYGTPSRVMLRSHAYFPEKPAGTEMGYDILIFYDKLGLLASYSGLVNYAPTYNICPTFSRESRINELNLYLQSPNNSVPLEILTPYKNTSALGFLTLEEATGMSMEDFKQLFTQKSQPICIDTPRDIWK